MTNVYIQWFIALKLFCFITSSKIGFSWWLPVATARGELKINRPANAMEWHAVGPQPAYKTFEDVWIVFLGSIVVKEWVFFPRGVLPYMGYIGTCRGIAYGF